MHPRRRAVRVMVVMAMVLEARHLSDRLWLSAEVVNSFDMLM